MMVRSFATRSCRSIAACRRTAFDSCSARSAACRDAAYSPRPTISMKASSVPHVNSACHRTSSSVMLARYVAATDDAKMTLKETAASGHRPNLIRLTTTHMSASSIA